MASIPGSQFLASAKRAVNVVETGDGRHLPPPIGNAFNLEIETSSPLRPPAVAAGYDGLAVLGPGGNAMTLVSGAFEIIDGATGGASRTLIAEGNAETIGGAAGATDVLVAEGSGDLAIGAGRDTIDVRGSNDSVDGGGNDLILVDGGSRNGIVAAGTGHDTINVFEAHNTIQGGSGTAIVSLLASNDAFSGGTGNYAVAAVGDYETIYGGGGRGSLVAIGNHDALTGGTGGRDSIQAIGDDNTVSGAVAPAAAGSAIGSLGMRDVVDPGRWSTVIVAGDDDTVDFGASASGDFDTVTLLSGNQTLVDGGHVFADTVIGFDQRSGDRIQLESRDTVTATALTTGGHDTLITLSDASTILLKGVTHVDHSFFE